MDWCVGCLTSKLPLLYQQCNLNIWHFQMHLGKQLLGFAFIPTSIFLLPHLHCFIAIVHQHFHLLMNRHHIKGLNILILSIILSEIFCKRARFKSTMFLRKKILLIYLPKPLMPTLTIDASKEWVSGPFTVSKKNKIQ